MVTVPAFVWRRGFIFRALTIGVGVGSCVGVLAWLDSGFLLPGVVVFVIVGAVYGTWMARRMARYWPAAKELDGSDRVAVVRAVRRGEHVDPRLTEAAVDYASGMRAAAESMRLGRWLVPVVLAVAGAAAVYDAIAGSWGNAIVSAVYLAALLVEVFWWPRRQAHLLANLAY